MGETILQQPVPADEATAIRMLKDEHRIFVQLFEEFEKDGTARDRKVEIVQEACLRLDVHAAIEEELFYPMLARVIDPDEVEEAIVEHNACKVLADELREMLGSEANYDMKFHVLGEQVRHHAAEEEEEMFEEAKASSIDLDELGRAMQARRQELLGEVVRDVESEAD